MILKIFICGPLQNNTYVGVCKKTKKAFVIDPSFGSYNKVEKFIKDNNYTLDKILLTHAHWDHITDVLLLKDVFNSLVCIHKNDLELLQNPQKSTYFSAITIPSFKPDMVIEDNQKILVGEIQIEVIHTPGHTPGCVCYYIAKEKVLFSGDTLFKGSFGRVDFSYSNAQDMIKSLKKLSTLPEDTTVYPGHGSKTTIQKEEWIKNSEKYVR